MPETNASLDRRVERTRLALGDIAAHFGPTAFGTSFGAEDMVLLDLIDRDALTIEVFTLDTGRLPEETYSLMQRVRERYLVKVRVYYPDTKRVEHYVRINGINAFYESVAQRKDCCRVRKVEPLARALAGKQAWITGMRREQAPTRATLSASAHDPVHGLTKFNPLVDWTLNDVWNYLKHFNVPYNELHDRGYPSIGCAPCTRAVKPGEDVRAGRWWWETTDGKECGLHPTLEEQQKEEIEP